MASTLQILRGLASSALRRTVQFTEEKFGDNDRTVLEEELRLLIYDAEKIKSLTERIFSSIREYVSQTSGLMHAHQEQLGDSLIDAIRELNPRHQNDSILFQLAKTQIEIHGLKHDFAIRAKEHIIEPMRRFLDEDAKSLTREKKILELRRQDFDAARKKFRRAKPVDQALNHAGDELAMAQDMFDMQTEILRAICHRVIEFYDKQFNQLLRQFTKIQAEFYEESSKNLRKLIKGTGVSRSLNWRKQNQASLSHSADKKESSSFSNGFRAAVGRSIQATIATKRAGTSLPGSESGSKHYSIDFLKEVGKIMGIELDNTFSLSNCRVGHVSYHVRGKHSATSQSLVNCPNQQMPRKVKIKKKAKCSKQQEADEKELSIA